MVQPEKNDGDVVKPLDNHASSVEEDVVTTEEESTSEPEITTLDNHASGGEATLLDNHASGEPV